MRISSVGATLDPMRKAPSTDSARPWSMPPWDASSSSSSSSAPNCAVPTATPMAVTPPAITTRWIASRPPMPDGNCPASLSVTTVMRKPSAIASKASNTSCQSEAPSWSPS